MTPLEDKLARLAKLRELGAKVDADIEAAEADIRAHIKAAEAQLRGRPKRRSRAVVPECATESAYQRHRYYGEPIDEACRKAHTEHERARRQRKEKAA